MQLSTHRQRRESPMRIHTHTHTRFLATRVVLQEKASPTPSFFSSFTHVLGSHGGCSASWPHPLSMSADTESTHYPSTHSHTHTHTHRQNAHAHTRPLPPITIAHTHATVCASLFPTTSTLCLVGLLSGVAEFHEKSSNSQSSSHSSSSE